MKAGSGLYLQYYNGMQITVFGANGRVGSLVVAEALKRGHHVRAFVHSTSPFELHAQLKVIQGDIYSPDEVAKALTGAQAVLSALGSWHTPKMDILTTGMLHIIPYMQANNIKRIVSLTGSGANAPGEKVGLFDKVTHQLMQIWAPKILADGEKHIQLLAESTLDWTVIRSPFMNEYGQPERYKLSLKRPASWATINRHSVALALLDQMESTDFNQQSPFISRG